MATSRGQTPPINLKERIAALQQRNVSPNTHQSAQAAHRGLPSPGSGGLRDKIAKFEEKGGTPVPRGSFAIGAPQLAENAPPKKRGELYGNRVPGLGKPSGPPVGSRPTSPLPSTDDSPAPRKRCISTGTTLASAPSSFPTDEPVPALPNGLATARRNSLAVNFGSARREMSSNDAEDNVGESVNASSPSLASLVPEKPPDPQPSVPESDVKVTSLEVEQPELDSSEAPNVTAPLPLEPCPVVEEPLPADSEDSKIDTLAEDAPPPKISSPLYDASRNVSQSPSTRKSSKDGLSEYESAPQSAISQPSPSLPQPPSSMSSLPVDTPSYTPKRTPTPSRSQTIVTLTTPPPGKVTKQTALTPNSPAGIPATSSTEPVPSVQIPNPTTESQPHNKSTFRAVVHRKVTEQSAAPPASSLAPPPTSQHTRQRRGVSNINVIEMPPSPGIGDLAVLLEDAAMLELRLTEGDGKAKELFDKTPTSATFQPDVRHTSGSTLTEHTSMPSVDSGGSQSMRSIPSIREPLIDGEIPEGEETDGRSLASTTFSQRSPSHRKYLNNIYRLTGRRSSSYMPGAYPRDSMSMSSEDSSPVTTPSDNGKRKGFGIAWPTSSPKKGGPNVSRSSSFADKIFRSRTRSNASTADQGSERNSIYGSSQPSLTLTFPSELSLETRTDGVDANDTRSTSWISPGDSTSEFSPASSLLDKDIFDAFPSVPQTLPPGFHLDAGHANVGRASTLPVNSRKQVKERLAIT